MTLLLRSQTEMIDKSPLGREQLEGVKTILRDRQVWLRGELNPLSRDSYSDSEINAIAQEITLINHLFYLWKVNPY